jgi:Nuclease-related domain
LKFSSVLPPAIFLLGLLAFYFLIFYLFRSFYRLKKRRSPFTQNFLRSPGHSLSLKLSSINEEISCNWVTLIATPLYFFGGFFSHVYFTQREIKPEIIALWIISGSILIIFFLYKTLKLLKKRCNLRLGYEGEIAVGQELNQLMLEGNHVYHDFPADKFNIDHIVVGRSGIFAVETKARSKPTSKNRNEDATVEYNGKMLMFPNGDDYKIIEQAERQTSWLSKWISSAIGEQVAARAIVALPGWFVKRTSADGISVVNPKQFPSLFKHIKPRTLTDDMISRIVHQLEQKCRDVVPGSKSQADEQPSA